MLSLVSRYRSCIMAIAAILVVLVHSGLVFQNELLRLIVYYGYTGVDLFLFVSGFGLFHALYKRPSLKTFFRRRMLRIYPAYIPALLVWIVWLLWCGQIVGWKEIFSVFFGNLLGYDLYLSDSETLWYNWYVLALPLYYLLSPLFVRIIERYKKAGLTTLLLLSVFCMIPFFGKMLKLRMIARFPVYILGFWFGFLHVQEIQAAKAKQKKLETGQKKQKELNHGGLNRKPVHREDGLTKISKGILSVWQVLFWILLAIVDMVIFLLFAEQNEEIFSYYGLWWNLIAIMTPGWVFALAWMLDRIDRLLGLLTSAFFAGLPVGWLLGLLELIGAASFEIYLVHLRFFAVFKEMEMTGNLFWGAAVIIMIAFGIVYHLLIEHLISAVGS